ncbi:MAG: bifunctional glutamate N-acetyltransferase/amino-acid acetyltransferase ArgJ [Acutalibacteraceae bacterium]
MADLKFIDGGVCAPIGFVANGIHCGIRKNKIALDLALIAGGKDCDVAAVYTQNLVCGAPITVTKRNIIDGKARAIVCNSGIANTCNADGVEKAQQTCEIVAKELGISPADVVVASTGVIGVPLNIEPIKNGVGELVNGLDSDGSDKAARAIMTTDTRKKEVAVEFYMDDKLCKIGAISKGSGMIHPNMATMLSFITTDVNITSQALQMALDEVVADSFNMLSVDGDTSTNDTVCVLANGFAQNMRIVSSGKYFDIFVDALRQCCIYLAREMARDGEGATKLIECTVSNASDEQTAKKIAKSVICSSLVKTAMFGADANWGRVLCAIGYSGADIDISKVDVSFVSQNGTLDVCKNGAGINFSEEIAKQVLSSDSIEICVNLNEGKSSATAFGCDLTYDYVKINGDYRT